MALTSAGLESRTASAMFEAVVVEVSYFALDMAVDFMTSRSEGDGCDQTTFSPILFPVYKGGRCRQGCIAFCLGIVSRMSHQAFCGRRYICSRRSMLVGPLSGHG